MSNISLIIFFSVEIIRLGMNHCYGQKSTQVKLQTTNVGYFTTVTLVKLNYKFHAFFVPLINAEFDPIQSKFDPN